MRQFHVQCKTAICAGKLATCSLMTASLDLVCPAGVEPTTLGFGNQYSIQLSYGHVWEVLLRTAIDSRGHFTSASINASNLRMLPTVMLHARASKGAQYNGF